MAKFEFELAIEPRQTLGKGASRRLRRENKVLGVVYGAQQAPQSVSLNRYQVQKALENKAIYSHILTLSEQGNKQKVVLKDIQRHPYKPQILHMDFLRIDESQPITMHVPLSFVGQEAAPGVTAGGIVTHHMVELEIRCLPRDLPEYIEIDLTTAPLDTVVHLSAIKLPSGVELLNATHSSEDDLPVVSIHKAKASVTEEVTPEAAATEPAAKPAPKSENKANSGKKK